MKRLTAPMLDELVVQAQHSARWRANHNLHEALDAPVQRLAIAMEPDTLILPHRHLQSSETLIPLQGRFVALAFDAAGRVTARAVLGEDCSVVDFPAGEWHAVLSLDAGGVIFEVKQGPYLAIPPGDVAAWSVGKTAAELNAWYATAQPGEQFPG